MKPTLPNPVPKGGGVYDHPENYPAVGKLQIDLLVTALACDLTRVGSLHWGTIASNQLFPHLNIPDFHHALSHDYYVWPTQTTPESYVEEKLEKIRKINFWHAQQLAYLLDRLASVQEADGSTLLENTVIFRVNEMCSGPGHNNGNLPAILIGGARGAIRTGRYMQVPPTPLNNLYVSIAQAMDVNVSTFGMPKFDFLQQDELTGWHPMQRSVTVGPMAGLT